MLTSSCCWVEKTVRSSMKFCSFKLNTSSLKTLHSVTLLCFRKVVNERVVCSPSTVNISMSCRLHNVVFDPLSKKCRLKLGGLHF